MTISNKKTYKAAVLVALLIVLVLCTAVALIWPSAMFGSAFFFIAVLFALGANKTVRQLTLEGQHLEVTYQQWGRTHRVHYNLQDIVLHMVTTGMGTVPYQSLNVLDKDRRVLLVVKTGDGYAVEDLQSLADAARQGS